MGFNFKLKNSFGEPHLVFVFDAMLLQPLSLPVTVSRDFGERSVCAIGRVTYEL